MSKKDDMSRVSAKDDDPVRKLCVRFNRDYKQTRDFKDAVAYLSLRGNGCPRKEAILFAAKNNCRVDTTKNHDGPRDHRTLKVQQVPLYMISEGWLYGQQDYNLGSCFPSRYSSTFLDYQNNMKLEENFDEQEIKMRKEYKEMISRMKDYVNQINQKYNLSNQRGDNLIEMVKKIVKGMKNELENRQYFVMNNVRYYDAADAIMKRRMLSEEEKNILTEKLNVFNNYENDEDFNQVQIIKVNDEDQNNEDNSPMKNPFFQGMFNNSLPRSSSVLNKNGVNRSSNLVQPSSQGGNISYAHQLKNLECATNLLEEFEKGEGEDLPNGPSGKFDRSYANQKKKRQEQMKQNLHLVREENQAGLEGQFNSQKYFFSKDENKYLNLRKEQQEKEDLQNAIFHIYRMNDEDGYYKYIDQVNEQNQIEKHISKDKMQHSQSSIAIGLGEHRKKSMDTQEKEFINMEIIKSMKQRQDVFQEHFRNKISTSTAPHRNKQYFGQPQSAFPFRNSVSSNNKNRQLQKQSIFQSNNQYNSNNQMVNRSQYSTLQVSPNGTYNMLSNHQSLTNLSSRKNNNNHLMQFQKSLVTPSTNTAARLTPLHTSNQLNSKHLSQIQTSHSFNRSSYPTAGNIQFDKPGSRQKVRTANQSNEEQKPVGRRQRQKIINNNINSQEILPSNRTVTWFVKGQQTQPVLENSQIQNEIDKNQKVGNIGKQGSHSRNNSSSQYSKIRNSSPTSSPSQNSPANKLAQQYYYQGANPAGQSIKANYEKGTSLAKNETKGQSQAIDSGYGLGVQTTNSSNKGNVNYENTPQSLLNSD